MRIGCCCLFFNSLRRTLYVAISADGTAQAQARAKHTFEDDAGVKVRAVFDRLDTRLTQVCEGGRNIGRVFGKDD